MYQGLKIRDSILLLKQLNKFYEILAKYVSSRESKYYCQ